MAEIRVEANEVAFGKGHLYLVYTDDAGQEFVLRGGPLNGNPANFGPIVVEVGVPIIDSADNRPIADRAQFGSVVLDTNGQDHSVIWDRMLEVGELMHSAEVNYNAYFYDGIFHGANSNSAISFLLSSVGLNIEDNLPDTSTLQNITIWDDPLIMYPGIGHEVNIYREFIDDFEDAIKVQLESDDLSIEDALHLIRYNNDALIEQMVVNAAIDSDQSCFVAGTPIDMWPTDPNVKPNLVGSYDRRQVLAGIWKKPIEQIKPDDWVVSFENSGALRPGRVTRTMKNQTEIILDFFGVGVTPGHVYHRADSKKADKFESLIDILRADGVIQKADGTRIRAATGLPIDDPRDGFVWAVTGDAIDEGRGVRVKDKGKLRLGTRVLTDDGRDFCIDDLIRAGGGTVTANGLIRLGEALMPFHWAFSDLLPRPEDYILKRSRTTLEHIFGFHHDGTHGVPRLHTV